MQGQKRLVIPKTLSDTQVKLKTVILRVPSNSKIVDFKDIEPGSYFSVGSVLYKRLEDETHKGFASCYRFVNIGTGDVTNFNGELKVRFIENLSLPE